MFGLRLEWVASDGQQGSSRRKCTGTCTGLVLNGSLSLTGFSEIDEVSKETIRNSFTYIRIPRAVSETLASNFADQSHDTTSL